jgi:hypothetical protein
MNHTDHMDHIRRHHRGGLYRRVNPNDGCCLPQWLGDPPRDRSLFVLYLPLSGVMPSDAIGDCFATSALRWEQRFTPVDTGNLDLRGFYMVRLATEDNTNPAERPAHIERRGIYTHVSVLCGDSTDRGYLTVSASGALTVGAATLISYRKIPEAT